MNPFQTLERSPNDWFLFEADSWCYPSVAFFNHGRCPHLELMHSKNLDGSFADYVATEWLRFKEQIKNEA